MTVRGDGHVSINGVRYLLDEGTPKHYVHKLPGILAHDERIMGTDDKRQAHVERLTWDITDWSGGEGNRVYYEDQPAVYDYGVGVNTRIPGQVGPRPKRDRTTFTHSATNTTDTGAYVRLFSGVGKLWLFANDKVGNGDGDNSWADKSPASLPTSHFITAAAADNENVYITSRKAGAASNDRLVGYSVDSGTTWRNMTTSEALNSASTVESSKNGYFGMAMHHGKLFAWTGRKLFTYDVANLTGSNALSSDQFRKVFDTGSEPGGKPEANTAWADVVDCGNAVAFFQSTPGNTQVYLYKQGVARPIWTKPGFTCKGISYNSGLIYLTGTFSAASSGGTPGHGAMYAIPLNNLSEIFLKWVRKTIDSNLQMQVANSSYGNQMMVCAAHTGRLWIYDLDYNSLSMLDDIGDELVDKATQETANQAGGTLVFANGDHRIGDVYSFGKFRIVAIYRPGTNATTCQTLHYYNDEPAQRVTTATSLNYHADSPEHDFGYPNDLKALLGFRVSFWPEGATTSGLVVDQRIRVQYALDDGPSPTFTTAATITSSTTPVNSTLGKVTIDLTSSTLKFTRLRVRILVDNTSNASAGTVKPPIVWAVTAESELLAYDEMYDLVLRIKDEENQTRRTNPKSKASLQRDVLVTAKKNRSFVAFIDGYLYREKGRVAATQTVMIDDLEDVIDRNAEGIMRVRLRVVPT